MKKVTHLIPASRVKVEQVGPVAIKVSEIKKRKKGHRAIPDDAWNDALINLDAKLIGPNLFHVNISGYSMMVPRETIEGIILEIEANKDANKQRGTFRKKDKKK